jgi:hypothetical protein
MRKVLYLLDFLCVFSAFKIRFTNLCLCKLVLYGRGSDDVSTGIKICQRPYRTVSIMQKTDTSYCSERSVLSGAGGSHL